ncbi:hypothetical protein [Paenibacillus sp. FSL K6-1230]
MIEPYTSTVDYPDGIVGHSQGLTEGTKDANLPLQNVEEDFEVETAHA